MFERNGEKLGSVLHDADPGNAGSKRARKSTAKAATKPEDDETPSEEPAPEPKKAAFKSALDKKE